MKYMNKTLLVLIVLMTYLSTPYAATTKFNYQGKVIFNGTPANGSFAMDFVLYDAMTDGVFLTVTSQNISISNGLLNTELDFGDGPFDGQDLFLELRIHDPINIVTWILSPRIPINASPYAIQANFVANDGVNSLSILDNSITKNDIANGVIPWNDNNNGIDYMAGNVGIGTNNPTGLLHIQGDSTKELRLYGDTSSPVIHFRRETNSADWVLKQNPDGTKFHIQSELADGNEVLTVDNAGKVGIGTTMPTGVLEVRNSSNELLLNVNSDGVIERKVQTQFLTLGYHSFQSSDSRLNYIENSIGGVDGFESITTFGRKFIGSIVLPHGSKIVAFSLLAFDNNPGADVTAKILQNDFAINNSPFEVVSVSTIAAPGATIVNSSTINHIFNSQKPYYVTVLLPPDVIPNTTSLFSAVRIEYEVNTL